MPTPQSNIFLLPFCDIFERLLRLETYLDELQAYVQPAYHPIIAVLSPTLQKLQQEFFTYGSMIAKESFDLDDTQQKYEFRVLHRFLRKYSRWFIVLHETLAFLPRPHVLLETEIAIEKSFAELRAHCSPTIVLGSVFNALEYDFSEVLRHRIPDIGPLGMNFERAAVLQLPICDRRSPVAWGVLGHEFGHAYYDTTPALKELVSSLVDKWNVSNNMFVGQSLHSWASEVVADVTATSCLGASWAVALVEIHNCLVSHIRAFHQEWESHPILRTRLRYILDCCGETSLRSHLQSHVDSYWEVAKHMSSVDTGRRARLEENMKQADRVEDFILNLAHKVTEFMKSEGYLRFVQIDSKQVLAASEALGDGLPIGAQEREEEDVRGLLDQASAIPEGSEKRTKFREALEKCADKPSTIPLILCAGAVRRLKERNTLFIEALNLGVEEGTKRFRKRLSTLDDLLILSIETSSILEKMKEDA